MSPSATFKVKANTQKTRVELALDNEQLSGKPYSKKEDGRNCFPFYSFLNTNPLIIEVRQSNPQATQINEYRGIKLKLKNIKYRKHLGSK